jgi:hypothetical protein
MRSKFAIFLVVIRTLLDLAVYAAYVVLAYRIAKITGHWEYGFLIFFVCSDIWRIAVNTGKKSEEKL